MWFLNSVMLLGLAGVALPVLAHLLSKKKYEVVRWGAMQFLELGRNTQRRVRLEEMWLMLLRMGLIAILAIALARPWISSSWFARQNSTETRDVVLVVDGSSSMGWEGKTATPHAAALQWAHRFLEQLRGGDTVALFEARDVVRPIVTPGTTDFRTIRQALSGLPSPAGGSDLAEAISQGLRLLNSAGNLTRDVIVLTDLQARAWNTDDRQRWDFLDEQHRQPTIVPRIWVVDVGGQTVSTRENFSLERIKLSREFTAPDMSVRIQTKLRHHGGQAPVSRKVYLEIDGQRLTNATLQSASIPPGGEFSVEFDHVFTTTGGHLVSIVMDPDSLPGDNRADAVIEVLPSLPVLVVDGAPHPDPTRSESFFLKIALGASSTGTALIKPQLLALDQLQPAILKDAQLLVLANVPQLTPQQVTAIQSFVDGGGGLFIALGDRVDRTFYNEKLFAQGQGVLPGTLEKIDQPPVPVAGTQVSPIQIDNTSLELPWLHSFRKQHQGGLTETRFDKWWQVTPTQSAGGDQPGAALPSAAVAARLTNGAPLLIERDFGHGHVLLMAAPLDSDWSTFPAKPDYVPFLHEALFHLVAGGRTSRNVAVGEPLLLPVVRDFDPSQWIFRGPGKRTLPVTLGGDELRPLAKLDDTSIPGIYTLVPAKDGQPVRGAAGESCVVNFDRRESDLTILTPEQREFLQGKERLKIVTSLDELRNQMFASNTKAEFWQLMLLVMLGMLVIEVWLTRRLVQGGHAVLDDD
ncbi:MAG: VWA domain-containing protein [Planctomycetota bacterium]